MHVLFSDLQKKSTGRKKNLWMEWMKLLHVYQIGSDSYATERNQMRMNDQIHIVTPKIILLKRK